MLKIFGKKIDVCILTCMAFFVFVLSQVNSVRLRDGPNSYTGRVEVYTRGRWSTVCGSDWDDRDAAVVCKQLGRTYSLRATALRAQYGNGIGLEVTGRIACGGMERRLQDCSLAGQHPHECPPHAGHASVECLSKSLNGRHE